MGILGPYTRVYTHFLVFFVFFTSLSSWYTGSSEVAEHVPFVFSSWNAVLCPEKQIRCLNSSIILNYDFRKVFTSRENNNTPTTSSVPLFRQLFLREKAVPAKKSRDSKCCLQGLCWVCRPTFKTCWNVFGSLHKRRSALVTTPWARKAFEKVTQKESNLCSNQVLVLASKLPTSGWAIS